MNNTMRKTGGFPMNAQFDNFDTFRSFYDPGRTPPSPGVDFKEYVQSEAFDPTVLAKNP